MKASSSHLTVLSNEAFHSLRSSSFSHHPKFKIGASFSEYQDTYLKPFQKANQNKANNEKNEMELKIRDFNTSSNLIKKMKKRCSSSNPEADLNSLIGNVKRQLEEEMDLKGKVRKLNKVELMEEVKTRTLKAISQKIQISQTQKDKENIKNQINQVTFEYRQLLETAERENRTLQDNIGLERKKNEEICNENEKLIRKNQIFLKDVQNLKGENIKLHQELNKLEGFKKIYLVFQERFPEQSLDKLIDRYVYLESFSLSLTKKINEIEDDKIHLKREYSDLQEKIEQNQIAFGQKNIDYERIVNRLKRDNLENEISAKESEKYKELYLQLFQKIIQMFTKYKIQFKNYFGGSDQEPTANLNDPVELLNLIDDCIKISSNEKLQNYLRKIIVSANLLQKTIFPDLAVEKFKPEKIYERIIQKWNQMKLGKNQDFGRKSMRKTTILVNESEKG